MPGASHPLSHDEAIQAFWLWQQQASLPGMSGLDHTDTSFVPSEALVSYLTERRILELLRAVYRGKVDRRNLSNLAHDIVAKEVQKAFAVLVLIDCGQLIGHFVAHPDDFGNHRLPLRDRHAPVSFPGNEATYVKFRKVQRQFCVRPLKNLNISVSADQILPIKVKEKLGTGASADAFLIELHQGYNEIPLRQGSPMEDAEHRPNEFVLKRYLGDDEEARESFYRERDVFAALSGDDAPELNLVGYHGWFTVSSVEEPQEDPCSYNIVLEYANCGNLEQFWRDPGQQIPKSAWHFWAFWKELFGLARALDRIHFVRSGGSEDGESVLRSIHHDIRPWNILVSYDPVNAERDFPYRFMLADLGLANLIRTKKYESTPAAEDPRSTLIYGAPEISRQPWQQKWRLNVAQAVDVWSLAATFSEALVWSTQGYAGVEQYRQERIRQSLGHGPRFHDGHNALPVVAEQHRGCAAAAKKDDNLVMEIVRLLDDDLLVSDDARSKASQLVHKIDRMMARGKPRPPTSASGVIPTRPSLPPLQSPSRSSTEGPATSPRESVGLHSGRLSNGGLPRRSRQSDIYLPPEPLGRRSTGRSSDTSYGADVSLRAPSTEIPSTRPSTQSDAPRITVEQLHLWWKSAKSRQNSNKAIALEDLNYLEDLKSRDLVFIIDDSASMKNHWAELEDLLAPLAYAIKHYDSDGMEYLFLNEGIMHKASSSKRLMQHVAARRGHCTKSTNAALVLEGVFDRYAKKCTAPGLRQRVSSLMNSGHGAPKPCSYFVFTDAVWQPKCKVARPIVDLLTQLRGFRKTQVGISFIQFGNDELGSKRLRFLDDELGPKYGVPDVIDYEPSNGNILKMMLGPTSDWWDSFNDVVGSRGESTRDPDSDKD